MDRNELFDSKIGVDYETPSAEETRSGTDVWHRCVDRLSKIVEPADMERWILGLRLIAEIDGEFVIAARDPLAVDRIKADHFHAIQRVWRHEDPAKRTLKLVCWRTADATLRDLVSDPWARPAISPMAEPATADADLEDSFTAPTGAPEATFDTLVTGESNEIAALLAMRVARNQPIGTSTALLFGAPGTGKTHILHALRTLAAQENESRNVLYLTAEEFMSAYHDGVRARDTGDLKKRLRAAHVLLIDDLHRIAGKPGTETELFQNIREVVSNGGIVLLAGDEAPGNVTGFGPRMRSQLKGSICAEISAPDQEMRTRIITQLADHILQSHPEFLLTAEMVERINRGIRGPGRELTGAVWSLFTEAGFGLKQPTMAMLDRVLRRHEGEARAPSIELVKKATMQVFGVSKQELESPSKARTLVYPRQIAMYLCRELCKKSLPQIGRSFGRRDHTTVLYSHRKVTKKIAKDSELATDIGRVQDMIAEMQASGAN